MTYKFSTIPSTVIVILLDVTLAGRIDEEWLKVALGTKLAIQ